MKSMNYSLIRTICALVIGLVLVLWPDAAINYIVITIGVLFLIPGFIVLIGYFGTKPEPGVSRRFPIEGVGNLLHTSHNQDKAQQKHQYVGKEPRHRDQPKSE